MLVTKTNKVRHLLLKILVREGAKHKQVDSNNNSIHFDNICEMLPKYNRALLLDNLDYLQSNKFIYCSMQFDNSKFHILSNGSHAFNEKKFLREGVKEQMNYLYDIVKNVSVIVLLIIGVWSFILNFSQTRRNTKLIEQQSEQIKAIKDSLTKLNNK